jgi:phosphoglycolate phosphatase-like HAD superfamily hydrolase
VLLVGDTAHDAEVARELGVDVVLVAGGHQSRKRLEATGELVVDGIEALFGVEGLAPEGMRRYSSLRTRTAVP